MTRLRIITFVAILIPACGGGGGGDDVTNPDAGDDTTTNDPVLTPGGGVTGLPVSGRVNVFVIDRDGGAVIANATVTLGQSGPTATTDASGLATFEDAALTGPQTITAVASGKVAATWIGVGGSSATIPLATSTIPTAHASGTITGWDSLPGPSFGNYNLAVVLYSFTDDIGASENHLTQPAGGGQPADTCLKSALSNPPCAWQLLTRTGRQIHFAAIVEGDPQGTNNDPSDDTYTLIGYAVGTSVTMTAGQQMTGENLTIVPAGSLTGLSVGFPAAPGGLGDVLAIPMLDLGDDGRIVFPLPTVTPGASSTQVIAATGQFAGSYDVVGLATPPGTSTVPYSTGFARGVSGTAQLPAWLPAPGGVSANGGTYSFTGADAASVRYGTFSRGSGTRLWSVSLLDGSSSFTLPTLTPDPLGTGSTTLEITAADVPSFSAAHFHVADLTSSLARASGASTTFTH